AAQNATAMRTMKGPPTNAPSVMVTRVCRCTISRPSSSRLGAGSRERNFATWDCALGPKRASDQTARCSAGGCGAARMMRSSLGEGKMAGVSAAGGLSSVAGTPGCSTPALVIAVDDLGAREIVGQRAAAAVEQGRDEAEEAGDDRERQPDRAHDRLPERQP